MKKVLGLDLGTTSIGWAFVHEAENEDEKSSIKRMGVRIVPISVDEENDFQKGKSISINAERTLKRGMRRNLQRYKQRRENLINILKHGGFINENSILTEVGKQTTFETHRLRAKAATEKIDLDELARVLLMINKKRGYKSNRKAKNEEEGSIIDGMDIAKRLYEDRVTPGQFVLRLLKEGKKYVPDFYRSDLDNEFQLVWQFQKQFYPEVLTDEFKKQVKGRGKRETAKQFHTKYKIDTAENKGNKGEVKIQAYSWRSVAIEKQLSIEEVAYVIADINSDLYSSSGYLGVISDRNKELYFNKETVGQYQYRLLASNPHSKLKNIVFYRQDYLDEFEKIWELQKNFHKELNKKLKEEIRDVIIFYQRRLKSQKHLISECEFEKHHKVIPKSSPLFQEFKIWQVLNNLEAEDCENREKFRLDQEQKELLFEELKYKNSINKSQVLKLLFEKPKNFDLNYEEIEGNRTNAAFYSVYQQILDLEGYEMDFLKMNAVEIRDAVYSIFSELGINTTILNFNSSLDNEKLALQPYYQLWHLVYSFEEGDAKLGNEKLLNKLRDLYGFKLEYARMISNIPLQSDYGGLSARAIRKILPYLREGNTYDLACVYAGYNQSSSKTAEEMQSRLLMERLELLPKNSLRNPVVEKILNQMANLVNAIIEDQNLGKPDEVRIELARELKKSSTERAEAAKNINNAKKDHQGIAELLREEFKIKKVTRNDIIKFKLYRELETNGYKTLYTDTYIPREKLFSKEFDIEHIIPQASLFDDSFSNKTISSRQVNIDKGNMTAYDFLKESLSEEDFNQYVLRVENLYKKGKISKAKYNKLLMTTDKIPEGFIDRELRDSQYIAKKARQMLEGVIREVNTTTGSITDRLRQDWQLIDVLKELNLPKYRELGLTETIEEKNGQSEERILDWTKRNDHRHHAMDALTVAFTKRSHVQYLNNLKARSNKGSSIYGIEKKELYRDRHNGLRFKPPMPLEEFRSEAKKHLESLLVSFKAKNKVATRNVNKTRKGGKDSFNKQITLTPRGQLHKETVYGCFRRYNTRTAKVGILFDLETIQMVAIKKYREALLKRLSDNEFNPRKAFGGSNSPSKKPVYFDEQLKMQVPDKVKLVWLEEIYSIRKDVSPTNFKTEKDIEKVIDLGIQKMLINRLKEFESDPQKAFSNLESNPIWLNKAKGISIKRVRIKGVTNVTPIHDKKDHLGRPILDEKGNPQPVDFVSTGNNHHVAIYRDKDGNLQEEVVSFYEAVHRKNAGIPIVNKQHEMGWEFLFTMKQNEYFVFPSKNFDPNEIDLKNPENFKFISPNLFRVQKLSTKNYVFNHHFETKAVDGDMLKSKKELAGKSYYFIWAPQKLEGVVKVQLNNLGKIIKIGEY
ncbi:MAG: type II CRISPR RNA-guided endonuclease Cas9 [Bacteroidales bacterium]|nr:type II CRISPR RNA-guided endonuclease Cas9 [Bacteroidales bacterium]